MSVLRGVRSDFSLGGGERPDAVQHTRKAAHLMGVVAAGQKVVASKVEVDGVVVKTAGSIRWEDGGCAAGTRIAGFCDGWLHLAGRWALEATASGRQVSKAFSPSYTRSCPFDLP